MNNRILALFACMILLAGLSSCAKTQPTNASAEPTEDNTVSIPVIQEAISGTPALYAEISDNSPAIAETVTVTVKMKNTAYFSSVDIMLIYDDAAYTVTPAGMSDIPNIVDSLNVDSGSISYGGFVLRSENVYDNTLFTINVTPNENARFSNSMRMECLCLLTSTEESGTQTIDKTHEVLTEDIIFTVSNPNPA